MGLMDKVKQGAETALNKAQQGVNQGKAKIDQAQSKRQWDGLLHNLGAAVWAEQREGGSSDAVTAAWAALDEHLASNGPVEADAGAEDGSSTTEVPGSDGAYPRVPQRSPTAAARLAIVLVAIVLLATVLLVAGLLATHRGGAAKAAAVGLKPSRLAGTWAVGPALPAEGLPSCQLFSPVGAPFSASPWTRRARPLGLYEAGRWDFDAHAGPAGGFGTITGLQCFANQTCTATDAEADVITYKDHKWAAKHGPTPNGGGPMGCASPTLCLFVDGVGQSYTWDGKAFSKPKVAYPSLANTMGSGAGYIACASGSTFCVVADQLGYLGTYAGGRWSPLARPFGLIAPLGAACVSPTDCIAPFPVRAPCNAGGDWAVWDGSRWNALAGGTQVSRMPTPRSARL